MNVPVSQPLSPQSLTALAEAAATISSTLELDSMLQTIARLALEVTRGEASTVFSLTSAGDKLVALAATGPARDALVGREFSAELGIPGQVLRTGQATHVRDVNKNPAFSREIDAIGSLRTHTLIAAPMVHRADVIGVIEVANRLDQQAFTPGDLKILQVFATLAAGAIQNARAHTDLQRRFDGLRDTVTAHPQVIGESPAFQEVLRLCQRVAPSSATVLILGETGTGKEVAARYIHQASRRREGTFVAVNCAALPETLLESELFGHEKGSFTSAHARRMGRFELADKGTLFLDEIGDISRSTQAKLLRVLQEKEFVRVGGSETIRCDVRIIAATNRNLKHMMADGVFREDLYYRLSVFPIRVPPLRERGEDLPKLVQYFVERSTREYRIPELRVAPETLRALQQYEWRGNIRELQNVIERSVLMSDGSTLLPHHLPPDIQAAVDSDQPVEILSTLHGQERAMVLHALEEHGWNQSQAARALGVSRYHLRHRIRKYNLQKPTPEAPSQQPT